MDNFELRTCIEIWKEEQEKISAIKRAFIKSKIEIEILKELLARLTAKEAAGKLSVLEKPMLIKLATQIDSSEKYFQRMELEYAGRQVELMVSQEKINIIEERVGNKEILTQEKESILKRIV